MDQKPIRLICPNLACRTLLGVPVAARGRVVRCRQCGTNVKVPPAPAKREQQGESADKREAG